MHLKGFNAKDHDEYLGELPVVPEGKYLAIIESSIEKPVKGNPNNKYLELRFQVVEGAHQGAKLWARLNLVNSNATAVKIAQQELGAICRAVNLPTPNDSADLHDLPLVLSVRVSRRGDTGALRNEIKAYFSKNSQEAEPQPQPDSDAPPWQR